MNALVSYTNQNYIFANIRLQKMKIKGLLIAGIIWMVAGTRNAQIVKDTLPAYMADSINAVYIYADTGKALNRIDKEGRKQGLWEKKYADGHLRYKGHFEDNRPYGVFKTYYDTIDSIQSIRVFSNEGKVAYAHIFYTTGALYAEGQYINEKEDSIWKFYDDMQRLIKKSQYKNGKKEGKSVAFYSNGNVLEVKNWKNDSADGPFEQYYDDGSLMEEGTYVHGQLQDTLYIYDMEGKIAVKGTYLNDMHEGAWIHYSDGEPKDTLIYHLGRCLNCSKYQQTQKQIDSLKLHYQGLQQRLDHPSDDLNEEAMPPDDGDE